jgi:hypothetical protein
MSQSKSTIVPVSVLFVLSIWGCAALYHGGYIPEGKGIFIFAMIIVAGVFAFVRHVRRYKDAREGFAVEDELSTQIRYKAGYYSFITSLYIWAAIFAFHQLIPDVKTMLGGGILLSAIASIGIKAYLTRSYDEK